MNSYAATPFSTSSNNVSGASFSGSTNVTAPWSGNYTIRAAADDSGNINPDEFRQLCEKLQPGMDEEDMEQALEELDSDGDGEISYDGASKSSARHAMPSHSSFLCYRSHRD